MKKSYISAISYYLPEGKEHNDPEDRLTKKIGIFTKNISSIDEYASDLACKAAVKLFEGGKCNPDDIDFLLYCTQSPDYILPTTACILQERLGLSTRCGALDINLGCSGYVYGLSLAKGLIEAGMAKKILFLTADTYSKYINPKDKSLKPLFGDAASATLISLLDNAKEEYIGSFVFGTDGKGAENLIIPSGGLREPLTKASYEEVEDAIGNVRAKNNLYMNGNEIFNFAAKEVPKAINKVLEKAELQVEEVNYFVLHQANQYMLETLRRKIGIPSENFSIQFADCGNTVSSTIPIALLKDFEQNKCKNGDLIMLVGFGVGYSWSACLIKLNL